MAEVHDAWLCTLGEGTLWHPERRQLFGFEILGRRLPSCDTEPAMGCVPFRALPGGRDA